ncbi:MAG: sugar ABC transporter substrate-binding protein [Lachnospiraceae bacterium]|nr:sugar ABC transporter substrate-binding protein [Lachnospiraceae bacterium]
MKWKRVFYCAAAAVAGCIFLISCQEQIREKLPEENVGEKETLSILLTYPREKEVLYQCIEGFTAETGIEVEIQYVPLSDSKKQISIMIVSENLPDVLDVDNPETATYAQIGILADVTDRVEREIAVEEYYQRSLEQNAYEGKYYGLPFTTNTLGMYYNKELLAQAGVEKVPQTWEEVLEACEKLKEIGVYGFGVAGNKSADTSFQMWPMIWSSGSNWDRLDSPETVEALEFYKTLVDQGYMSTEVINYNASDNTNQFIAGKTAMVIDGSWRLQVIQQGVNFDFGVARIPEGPEGFCNVLGGHNFAIVNNEHVDASWEFIKYMNRPDIMQKFSEAENYIPARRDVAEASAYFQTEPIRQFVEMVDYANPMPKENYNRISDIIIHMWQSVVREGKDPAQAAKEAGAAVRELK